MINTPGYVITGVSWAVVHVFVGGTQRGIDADTDLQTVGREHFVKLFLQRPLQIVGRAWLRYAHAEFHFVPPVSVLIIDELFITNKQKLLWYKNWDCFFIFFIVFPRRAKRTTRIAIAIYLFALCRRALASCWKTENDVNICTPTPFFFFFCTLLPGRTTIARSRREHDTKKKKNFVFPAYCNARRDSLTFFFGKISVLITLLCSLFILTMMMIFLFFSITLRTTSKNVLFSFELWRHSHKL